MPPSAPVTLELPHDLLEHDPERGCLAGSPGSDEATA
jgi:hypothetical protein